MKATGSVSGGCSDDGIDDGIDVVVTWVDPSDVRWRDARVRLQSALGAAGGDGSNETRYRDWDIFRYWFRALEKYCPWARHVYVVLSDLNDPPVWLKTGHPRVVIVRHSEIMRASDLPTFNSNAIELNIHRIPGLSERFVYFNDDIYPSSVTSPSDFFAGGLPRDMLVEYPFQPSELYSLHRTFDVRMLNRHFRKRSVQRAEWRKLLSPRMGLLVLSNVYSALLPNFIGFRPTHSAMSLRKDVLKRAWLLEESSLSATSGHRFRTETDNTLHGAACFGLLEGRFVVRRRRELEFVTTNEPAAIARGFRRRSVRLLCVNDGNAYSTELADEVRRVFEMVFPEPSSFEHSENAGDDNASRRRVG